VAYKRKPESLPVIRRGPKPSGQPLMRSSRRARGMAGTVTRWTRREAATDGSSAPGAAARSPSSSSRRLRRPRQRAPIARAAAQNGDIALLTSAHTTSPSSGKRPTRARAREHASCDPAGGAPRVPRQHGADVEREPRNDRRLRREPSGESRDLSAVAQKIANATRDALRHFRAAHSALGCHPPKRARAVSRWTSASDQMTCSGMQEPLVPREAYERGG
jgi:hypothetical protein